MLSDGHYAGGQCTRRRHILIRTLTPGRTVLRSTRETVLDFYLSRGAQDEVPERRADCLVAQVDVVPKYGTSRFCFKHASTCSSNRPTIGRATCWAFGRSPTCWVHASGTGILAPIETGEKQMNLR